MTYEIHDIARTLRAARQSKGLSQRALGAKANVPQSHISNIEKGTVDLRLSSLIELARVLDLELALVPRKALPAVQSIARTNEAAPPSQGATDSVKELQRLERNLARLGDAAHGSKELAQFLRQARDLKNFQLAVSDVAALKKLNKAVESFKNDQKGTDALRKQLANLQNIRNAIAHGLVDVSHVLPTRPAYTLDEEDSDG